VLHVHPLPHYQGDHQRHCLPHHLPAVHRVVLAVVLLAAALRVAAHPVADLHHQAAAPGAVNYRAVHLVVVHPAALPVAVRAVCLEAALYLVAVANLALVET